MTARQPRPTGDVLASLTAPPDRVPPHQLPELMDSPQCDRAGLQQALASLEQANRLLGGARLLERRLRGLLRGRRPGPLRLLDVGCGGGDLARRLGDRLTELGWSPSFVLADLHPATLEIARELANQRGDGFRRTYLRLDGARLPLGAGSVDVALSSTTLHHLERESAIRFLSELARVSRVGWIVTDLRRSRATLLATRLLAATLWRRRTIVRTDGPISARRAFTTAEALELVAGAGAAARIEGRLFRLAIEGGKPPGVRTSSPWGASG